MRKTVLSTKIMSLWENGTRKSEQKSHFQWFFHLAKAEMIWDFFQFTQTFTILQNNTKSQYKHIHNIPNNVCKDSYHQKLLKRNY